MESVASFQCEPVSFRFFADFEIRIRPQELSQEQHDLLQAIQISRPALRNVARMALETDLAGLVHRHLSNLFEPPSYEDVLDSVLPYLSDEARAYWMKLRDAAGDSLHCEIEPVFLAFEVTLRRAGLDELSAAAEPIKKHVGPTLDARNL